MISLGAIYLTRKDADIPLHNLAKSCMQEKERRKQKILEREEMQRLVYWLLCSSSLDLAGVLQQFYNNLGHTFFNRENTYDKLNEEVLPSFCYRVNQPQSKTKPCFSGGCIGSNIQPNSISFWGLLVFSKDKNKNLEIGKTSNRIKLVYQLYPTHIYLYPA